MSSCFLTVPWFLLQINSFLLWQSPSCFFYFPVISRIRASGVGFRMSYAWSARALRNQEREGNARSGGIRKIFVQVCMKLFWREIYCANNRPKPDPQSLSLSHRGLGIWAPWIIHEYDLATANMILLLIQTCRCKMDYYIFSAMASFPRMSST